MKELMKVQEAVDYIKAILPQNNYKIALYMGVGVTNFDVIQEIKYADIPNMPDSSYGSLLLAQTQDKYFLVLKGKSHLYEGYDINDILRPIRILSKLGIETLIISSISGAVNEDFEPGELMLVNDHIDLHSQTILNSESIDFGNIYLDLSNLYNNNLQDLVRNLAIDLYIPLNEGIYMKFNGPYFETQSEINFARNAGADVVGHGLVIEAIGAKQLNMDICGISKITNMASGMSAQDISFENMVTSCDEWLNLLIKNIIPKIN